MALPCSSAILKGVCEVNCSNTSSNRSCARQISDLLLRSPPLDGGIEIFGRGFKGGPFFVGFSCGLASGGTEGDCFGFDLVSKPDGRECANGPVVLGPLAESE